MLDLKASKPTDVGGSVKKLSGRLTLRLSIKLMEWVRHQGGSSFVRELLAQQQEGQTTARPADRLREEWEHLGYERESLKDEREILEDEERRLDRRESNLDRERERLAERREWLEDEWYELEQIRMKLEEREEALDAAANSVSDIGSFAQRALSDKYPETRGPP